MLNNKSRLALFILCFLFLAEAFCAEERVLSEGKADFSYNSKGRRNPFMSLVTPDGRIIRLETEGTGTDLLLEGIIYDNQGLSYAIVNGAVVKVGDEIAGYQVLKIEEDRVIFIKEGEMRAVEIKKEEE